MEANFALGLLAAATALAASVTPAQPENGEILVTAPLKDFKRVWTVGPQEVVITVGPEASIRAAGSAELLEQLEVVTNRGTLRIQPKAEFRQNFTTPRDHGDAAFYVSMPRLTEGTVQGSGRMKIDQVGRGDFSASVAGSGEIEIGFMSVDDARFSILGSGDITANGIARHSKVNIVGAGNLRAQGVTSERATVEIVGAGGVELTVEDDARISIVGRGDVDIAGPARCNISRMDNGNVRCESA